MVALSHPAAVPALTQLRLEPVLARIGFAMLLSLALTVPAFLLDDRTFQGESVWLKPIKFQIALTVYLLTLSLYAGLLPQRLQDSRFLRRVWGMATLATLTEMVWIGGAAMFATASHYNPVGMMAMIYPLMGVVAVLLTSASLFLGLAFWRDRDSGLPDAVRSSLALGLILTFGLTVLAAGVLSSMPGHFIGTPVSGAVVPILGWSREVGDLRVAHFLATHALHAVPLVGLIAVRLLAPRLAVWVVWASACVYAALTVFTLVQALGGQPVI